MSNTQSSMKPSSEQYFNRELSWLEFNQRVLDVALDETQPLLERLKFLAIAASNLDEFFMVRVGGLQLMSRRDIQRPDPAGMSPHEQLEAIRARVRQMLSDQYECFNKHLEPALREAGIRRAAGAELNENQHRIIFERFEDEFFSVLSPIAVYPGDPVPMLPEPHICLCVRLRSDQAETPYRYCLIPLGTRLPRLLTIPSDSGYEYMLLEDVVARFVERFFPDEQVVETIPFRVTRNADLTVSDEIPADFLAEMEHVLQARKESHCVRLELDSQATATLQGFLADAYEISPADVYPLHGPLDLSELMPIAGIKGFDALTDEPWDSLNSAEVDPSQTMFDQLAQKDILLVHPYESFDPVVRLIEEAAQDPDVLSIKQTLYRTSSSSPIVAALMQAATSGKYVTVIVELKARFDEARNIEWAKQLEREGVNVIYGVRGLKTHAKCCVIVRQESQGIRRYVHFGTGNYNERTARLYSDVSYMTSDLDLGADAVMFFNAITGHSQPQPYHRIESAPLGLKSRLLEMIDVEIDQASRGENAFINGKVNSLVDPEVIDALYRASQAGVKVRLNIRGICCLRPGVQGLSENIEVTSIIDRYLEHARIVHFHHGGDDRVFISSADWMPRNLDRRIELLVPVDHEPCKSRLIHVLETYFRDTAKAKRLMSDGSYQSLDTGGESFRSQEFFYQDVKARTKDQQKQQMSVFQPLKSPV